MIMEFDFVQSIIIYRALLVVGWNTPCWFHHGAFFVARESSTKKEIGECIA